MRRLVRRLQTAGIPSTNVRPKAKVPRRETIRSVHDVGGCAIWGLVANSGFGRRMGWASPSLIRFQHAN